MSVRLFVGNLSYDVTESDLREFFSPVGPLSAVIIPMDRDTGKPRGFAFIEFEEQAQADEATNRFNNQELKGRNVTINEARARDSRPGPRPGGGGAFRPGPSPRPSPRPSTGGGSDVDSDPMGSARMERAERRQRNFGTDAKANKKKKSRHGSRNDSGPRKGPIRERSGGQFFGNADDDDDFEDVSDYKHRW